MNISDYIKTVAPFYTLEIGKSYHNITHIEKMLNIYFKYESDIVASYPDINKELLITSILWHDASYSPYNKENEKTACEIYKNNCSDYDERVVDIIMSTVPFNKVFDTPEKVILHDLDWFGFSDIDILIKDEKLIEQEYEVAHSVFVEGRRKFYENCLVSFTGGLFKSVVFEKFNEKAILNIKNRVKNIK